MTTTREPCVRTGAGCGHTPVLESPVGPHVKDPWIQRREEQVRQLLDEGVLRTAALVEALLEVAPERYMAQSHARTILEGRCVGSERDGWPAPALDLRTVAMGLEALAPALGDRVVDASARTGWIVALLSRLVGPSGLVVGVHAEDDGDEAFAESLFGLGNVEVMWCEPGEWLELEGVFDGIWLGAAVPRVPERLRGHLIDPGGRLVAFVGPRFRPQDGVAVTRHGDELAERPFARVQVPVLGGPGGWLKMRQSVAAVVGQ